MSLENLTHIESEIRARAGIWHEETLTQYDNQLADRVESVHKQILAVADEMQSMPMIDIDAEHIYGWATQLRSLCGGEKQ